MTSPLPNPGLMQTRLEIAMVRDRIFASYVDEPHDVDGRLALYAEHDRRARELRMAVLL